MSEYDVPDLPHLQEGSDTPTQIQLASRVHRLPPYLFGRINSLLYEKRRAGSDVIDLGMGNPQDPPAELVIDKLAEAARDLGKCRKPRPKANS